MNKHLLQLDATDSLTIEKSYVKGADFSFDFKRRELAISMNDQQLKVSTYVINKGLVDAVNAAIITGRPLLLKGEPGCGKTKLAKSVASYFYGEELSKYYFEWHVKSKSKARDGAYTFDHVNRLRDATISNTDKQSSLRTQDPSNYISLGPMGLAFVSRPPEGKFPILLIDEIDKGDIDFPNDLLLELDEMRFAINELQEEDHFISAPEDNRPLVIITSNNERELPAAFLRRCLFYRIPPFENELLEMIAGFKLKEFYEELFTKGEEFKEISEDDVEAIVAQFIALKEGTAAAKPPSTSELLDWLKLILYKVNAEQAQVSDLIKSKELQKLALKLLN